MNLLIDYIPFACNAKTRSIDIILKSLRTILLILTCSLEAIEAFKKCQYHLFDPQVSESLCQVRAMQNCLMFYELSDDVFYRFLEDKRVSILHSWKQVNSLIKSIEYSFHSGKTNSIIIDKQCTVREYLRENLTDMVLGTFIEYITFSFILTKYSEFDENGISIGLNYQILSSDLCIDSITYASNFTHKLQRNLSLMSCEFIFRLIEKNRYDEKFWHMMKLFYQKDEVLRHVMPCYYVTKVILDHVYLFYTKLPIFLCVTFKDKSTAAFPFFLNESGFHYDAAPLTHAYEDTPCLVIQGISSCVGLADKNQWISELLRIGVRKVIMMNVAAHPQYAGKKLYQFKANPFMINKDILKQFGFSIGDEEGRFLMEQKEAHLHGCSLDNSRLFLIKHIYCDSPKNLTAKYGSSFFSECSEEEQAVSHT